MCFLAGQRRAPTAVVCVVPPFFTMAGSRAAVLGGFVVVGSLSGTLILGVPALGRTDPAVDRALSHHRKDILLAFVLSSPRCD